MKYLIFSVLCLILTACGRADQATSVPTFVLVSPTPTLSPVPPTITPTPTSRPDTSALLFPTPQDPSALVQQLLADDLNVSHYEVVIASILPFNWLDAETMDCDAEPDALRSSDMAGYEIIALHRDDVYVYHTDEGTIARLCEEIPMDDLDGEMLLKVDAVAADLVRTAQERLAEELNLSIRRIRLSEIHAIIWTDTSLGCPQPRQEYEVTPVNGYWMILTAGETDYRFHASFDNLRSCETEDVVMPGDE